MNHLFTFLIQCCLRLGLYLAIQFLTAFLILIGIAALIADRVISFAESFGSFLPSVTVSA